MNLAEMIDSVIAKGGDGSDVIAVLIASGHLPPDANSRPAGQTAEEVKLAAQVKTAFLSLEREGAL